MRKNTPLRTAMSQNGVMLLEVLVALIIFATGILGLVGLQASLIQQSGDAAYRAEASQRAAQLIGMMWAERLTMRENADPTAAVNAIAAKFGSCDNASSCPGYWAWATQVASLPGVSLPSSESAGSNTPFVQINSDGDVTVDIWWERDIQKKDNQEEGKQRVIHQFTTTTQIR